MVLSCLQRNPARRRCTPGEFYGNLLLQGGALAFTQLLLRPSICTRLSEEEIRSSTLKFALWSSDPSDVSSLRRVGSLARRDVFACLGKDKANSKRAEIHAASFLSRVFFCQLHNILSEKSASHQGQQAALGAELWIQQGSLPSGAGTPPELHTQKISAGQVNTRLRLIQQLEAVKRCDPPPRPALEWGLSAVLESMIKY